MKCSFAFAMLISTSAPAFSQVVTFDSNNAAPKQVAGDDNKVICETVQRTGSRLNNEKVCLTALQWRENKAGQRNDLEKWQERSNQEPSDPQGMASPR